MMKWLAWLLTKAVDIYPEFSKAFGIASHKIPLEKIMEIWAG